MQSLGQIFFGSKRFKHAFVYGFLISLIIGFFDYITGENLGFFLFYLIPIGIVTIYGTSRQGIVISVTSALTWFVVDFLSTTHTDGTLFILWNTTVRLFVFLLFSVGITKIRLYYIKSKTLSEFIVHDLRTPLTNILLGLSDIIESDTSKLTSHQKSTLDLCKVSADRMSVLIDSLLDLSKLEDSKFSLKPEDFEIPFLVETALGTVKNFAKRKNITLIKNFDPDSLTAFNIFFDRELLYRILINLLSNAIKVGPQNSAVAINVRSLQGNAFGFAITDAGPGIPKNMLKAIFDKFVQIEAREEGLVSGSGLGLTFCKEAVAAAGGRIWIESEPDKETTVFFEISSLPRH